MDAAPRARMQRQGHSGRAHYKPAECTYVRPPVAVRPYRRRRKKRGVSGGGGSPPQHFQLGPIWIRRLRNYRLSRLGRKRIRTYGPRFAGTSLRSAAAELEKVQIVAQGLKVPAFRAKLNFDTPKGVMNLRRKSDSTKQKCFFDISSFNEFTFPRTKIRFPAFRRYQNFEKIIHRKSDSP